MSALGAELNRTLATLLGWTEIVELCGALLGMPPGGAPHSRGQALVPDWHGDWRDCGPLIVMIGIDIRCWCPRSVANNSTAVHADHASPDAALRDAIVLASIDVLQKFGMVHAILEKNNEETA